MLKESSRSLEMQMSLKKATQLDQQMQVGKLRKRHRRGKRRSRSRQFSDSVSLSELNGAIVEDCGCGQPACQIGQCAQMNARLSPYNKRGRGLRPSYSPPAPHNSTQFLMQDSYLNLDFVCSDTLHFRLPAQSDTYSETPIVMNTEYESGSCLSRLEFMEKDFERAFSDARACNLLEKSRSELVKDVISLESRIDELEKKVCVKQQLSLKHPMLMKGN